MQVGACFDSGGEGCPVPSSQSTQEKVDSSSRPRHASAPLPQVAALLQKNGAVSEDEASGRESKRPRAVEDLTVVREDLAMVDQLSGETTKGSKESCLSKKEHQHSASVERPNRDLHRAQSIDSANAGETVGLRSGLRAKTIGVVSEGRESGELASCVRSSSRHSTAQDQGVVGQDEEPRREPSVQRRVSVAIRPDILGELPEKPVNGRNRGRRVTLSMVDETTEELRNTLQRKVEEIPDGRLPCDAQRKFPKEGRDGRELPPLNQATSGGTIEEDSRASRGDISADLQQLQRALRDIIPSGRELEEAKCNAPSASSHSSASVSGASSTSTKSSARSTRQNSSAGCGVQARSHKSARQKSAHRHCLEELPESGELADVTPSSRLESKLKVCSNSLADELARLDTKSSDGPSGNFSHRGEMTSHIRRIGDPPNIQRRAHRLFTS